jgi:hypothetical protein
MLNTSAAAAPNRSKRGSKKQSHLLGTYGRIVGTINQKKPVSYGGEGGTRTLDLGIMSATL